MHPCVSSTRFTISLYHVEFLPILRIASLQASFCRALSYHSHLHLPRVSLMTLFISIIANTLLGTVGETREQPARCFSSLLEALTLFTVAMGGEGPGRPKVQPVMDMCHKMLSHRQWSMASNRSTSRDMHTHSVGLVWCSRRPLD